MSIGRVMHFRRFIFRTRGVYLLVTLVLILWLKHRTGAGVGLPSYLTLAGIVLVAQFFRTWAAGFVGTTARGRETHAEILLTAGPYAYVRNPMYLGILVLTTALALMSGLWYAPLLVWATYGFVYSNVIPYEEAYLRERFGQAYVSYFRAVPRMVPAFRGYPKRQGTFRLREGLANEVAAWTGAVVLPILFYVL